MKTAPVASRMKTVKTHREVSDVIARPDIDVITQAANVCVKYSLQQIKLNINFQAKYADDQTESPTDESIKEKYPSNMVMR